MHIVHDWDRLLDDARAAESAGMRARERWLRRQATEDATLVGALIDLAEAGVGVSLWTAGSRRHEGRLVAIGRDFALLEDRADHVAVRLDALTVVRPLPGADVGPATGNRLAQLDLSLVELVGRLTDDGPDVALSLDGGDVVVGALVAAGSDVLTLRVAPGPDGLVYSSVARCASVRLRSG